MREEVRGSAPTVQIRGFGLGLEGPGGVTDCRGERIFHTGLPFQGEYTTFQTTEMLVEAGVFNPGQPYSAFVEFPHGVDSRVVKGVPGFTS